MRNSISTAIHVAIIENGQVMGQNLIHSILEVAPYAIDHSSHSRARVADDPLIKVIQKDRPLMFAPASNPIALSNGAALCIQGKRSQINL